MYICMYVCVCVKNIFTYVLSIHSSAMSNPHPAILFINTYIKTYFTH